MLRAERVVHRNASWSLIANTPYLIVVPTKQFVWPYLYMKMNEISTEMKKGLHCFWPKGGGDHKGFSAAHLALNGFLGGRTPVDDLHLDAGVFQRFYTLAVPPIVIHAWLAVFRAVDGVALAKFDFAKFVELVDLPSDKGVVVWVGVCRNECATPIYTKSQGHIVFL